MAHRRHIPLMRKILNPFRLILAHRTFMLALELNIQAMVSVARRRQADIRYTSLYPLPLELRSFNLVPLSAVWHMIHPREFRECSRLPFGPCE